MGRLAARELPDGGTLAESKPTLVIDFLMGAGFLLYGCRPNNRSAHIARGPLMRQTSMLLHAILLLTLLSAPDILGQEARTKEAQAAITPGGALIMVGGMHDLRSGTITFLNRD
jgi:hypothetical protein